MIKTDHVTKIILPFCWSATNNGKEATHLITGDKDLPDIKVFEKTKIITIADYLLKE
jgi:predicted nucleic acid-binding protein